VRGVLHGAAVVEDAALSNLSDELIDRCWAPKVYGAWNLHQALHEVEAGQPLDWFCSFSSAAALVGLPGQGAYAAANSWLDAFAHWRRAQGLSSTAIAWGAWSEVGRATALAEGAGVGAIVLAKDRTAGITPAAVKSSAGAWIHLKIARCGNVARTIEQLKEAGYWTAALAPGGDTSIYALDTSRKLAIIVGSEGRGVRDIVRKGADFVVDIPMRGRVGSLNVSVAAAVALFEIARRRAAAKNAG